MVLSTWFVCLCPWRLGRLLCTSTEKPSRWGHAVLRRKGCVLSNIVRPRLPEEVAQGDGGTSQPPTPTWCRKSKRGEKKNKKKKQKIKCTDKWQTSTVRGRKAFTYYHSLYVEWWRKTKRFIQSTILHVSIKLWLKSAEYDGKCGERLDRGFAGA